ncbi:MAG: BspA family leucine-rich repeat surface protein [Clostridia bacterium]|nr:BspA family leucine-rich repeat surface protein [Clostridia bacterium]
MDTNSHFLSLTSHSSGITLITLIITIVIMLILAGITINLTLGENGIFQKAKLAKGQYETASVQEKLELELAAIQMEDSDLTIEEFEEFLSGKNINGKTIALEDFGVRASYGELQEVILQINNKIYSIYLSGSKIKVEYEPKENVMKSNVNITSNWLGIEGLDKTKIKEIKFVDSTNENLDEKELFEVSAIGQENSVKCWWDEDQKGMFSVKVGAEGKIIAPRCSKHFFLGLNNLETIDFSNLDTSKITNMESFFNGCTKLGIQKEGVNNLIDMGNFETSNVTNMRAMFFGCNELTELDLSSFDTRQVYRMDKMFQDCVKITQIIFSSKFDTRQVETMSHMFCNSNQLKNIDLSSFNTVNVRYMDNMFVYCNNLENIDVSNFDTSKVTKANGMFEACSKLETLDVSNFNMAKVDNITRMFNSCSSLKQLVLGDMFVTENVTSMSQTFSGLGSLEELNLGAFGVKSRDLGEIYVSDMFYYLKEQVRLTVDSRAISFFKNLDVSADIKNYRWGIINGKAEASNITFEEYYDNFLEI